jgi:hypothetical protein
MVDWDQVEQGRPVDIAAWLTGLGLEQYRQAFQENDVDDELLRQLTGDDLKDIGVASLGHRKKLLEAIAGLNSAPSSAPVSTPQQTAGTARPDAERRQLTVMFIDLGRWDEIWESLPEDLHQTHVSHGWNHPQEGGKTLY